MAKPIAGTVVAGDQKVVNVVPGFGTSNSVPGRDWPTKWYGTMQMVMNYTEFFYKAIKAAYGPEEAMGIYMDAHIMQGKLTGDAFKKAALAMDKPLNCRTFIEYTYISSQMMGETFFCYQRPDGVYIYNTINQPHERLFLQMVEGATEVSAMERVTAWFSPAFASYNPETNYANLTHPAEHGFSSWAIWDEDVTPEEPIPAEGGDTWVNFGKVPETVQGKSWGPYYLTKPYIREDTVEAPEVDSSFYSKKFGMSPCAI
ncbi:hypothetical protein ACFLZL_01285 [Thermodesulfobacteriota bacterium]